MDRSQQIAALCKEARGNMDVYATLVDPRYRSNRFTRMIMRVLRDAALSGRGAQIAIDAQPQIGKSISVSRIFPAWVHGNFPQWDIMAASYGDDLAVMNGNAVRGYIKTPAHRLIFPGSAISPRQDAAQRYDTTAGGKYFGTTIRGGGTGFSSRVFIIDDPIKNRTEADSAAVRKEIHQWYSSVVMTRQRENTIVIVMNTRWHEDDLTGWLMREQPGLWMRISAPALAEDPATDPLGREVDEAAVESLQSAAWLKQLRAKLGSKSRDWLAMYQQRPSAEGGSLFRREQIRNHSIPVDTPTMPPQARDMNRYLISDPASGKNSERGDYVAIGVLGLNHDQGVYLLDLVYDRLNLIQRVSEYLRLHRKWQPQNAGYEAFAIDADSDHLIYQMELQNYRFDVRPLTGALSGSSKKYARIERLHPLFEQGRVYLPEAIYRTGEDGVSRNLVTEIIETELLPFPTGKHDDAIDMIARIFDFPPVWPAPRAPTFEDDINSAHYAVSVAATRAIRQHRARKY